MRRLILFVVVLFIAIWLGVKIATDPGYVLITYRHWILETPLWAAAVSLLLIFLLGYFLLRLSLVLRVMPQRWRSWFSRHHARRAYELTSEGLLMWSRGDLRQAQKKLGKAAHYKQSAWLDYMALASISNDQQNYSRRDEYLVKAQKSTPAAEVAVGLMQVNFLLKDQHTEQALAILQHLYKKAPQQIYILRSLVCLYANLKYWEEIEKLLPQIRKVKVYSISQFLDLEIDLYKGLLSNAEQSDVEKVQAVWDKIPRHLRYQAKLVAVYANVLIKKSVGHLAEDAVRKALNKNWDDALVQCYGLIKSAKPEYQLVTAESWLPDHKNDATLLLALGRIAIQNELWGKARSYFQASVAMTPKAETYLELAKLSEKLSDEKSALEFYRKGLELA